MTWWRDGVLYQCYPRSFADSDGDGVGDLRGIRERLDHLEWLGIDGLWLNPTFPSPNADWGFDVSDYRDVHPELGTLEDLDALVADCHARGMRVLLDLVPNHTSDEHPWFVESRSSRDSPKRSWYVWRDGRGEDGREPPNNWLSTFGGPAWERDEATGQFYLHNFDAKQPDLDWWSDEVRDTFDDILRFWLRRGIDGFRIDVAHGIVKDRELRDNPAATDADKPFERWMGQRAAFSMNREDVHDVYRRWRGLVEECDGDKPILVGETWVNDLDRLATFYGTGADELHLAFNFVFLEAMFDAAALKPIVAKTEAVLPGEAWPVWTLSNHDLTRAPTRWGEDDPRKTRLMLMLLLTLRGTPVLYYGDEIGMPESPVASEREVDPVALLRDPERDGRDGARAPMPWSAHEGQGFTPPGVEPWLPFGDAAAANVADQRDDPGSVLQLVHDLIALRRGRHDLRAGAYRELPSPDRTWVYGRGDGIVVALNLSDEPVRVEDAGSTVLVGTDRARDGEATGGTLALAPWEGVVTGR